VSESDSLTPPDRSKEDHIHRIVKAGLSAVPFAGGPLAELFDALVTPPLEKRRDTWRKQIAEDLRRLETEAGISLEKLQNNEAFISLLVQATVVAIRNHHDEKKDALRNCVQNAASNSTIDSDIQLSFVRFIDELSPSHISLLSLIRDLEEQVRQVRTYEELFQALTPRISMGMDRAVFKMMCVDLETRGLIWISQDIGDFPGIYEASTMLLEETHDDLPRVLVSQVGRSFLQFLSEPVEGAA
jgi:hypothetical protein